MEQRKKYFAGLTEAEWDEHERIEAELNETARQGFTEDCALAFVQTVVAIRKKDPTASIGAILDLSILLGLESFQNIYLGVKTKPAPKGARPWKTRPGVRLVK